MLDPSSAGYQAPKSIDFSVVKPYVDLDPSSAGYQAPRPFDFANVKPYAQLDPSAERPAQKLPQYTSKTMPLIRPVHKNM